VDNEFTRIGKNLFYLPEIRSQTHKTTQDLRTVGAQVELKLSTIRREARNL